MCVGFIILRRVGFVGENSNFQFRAVLYRILRYNQYFFAPTLGIPVDLYSLSRIILSIPSNSPRKHMRDNIMSSEAAVAAVAVAAVTTDQTEVIVNHSAKEETVTSAMPPVKASVVKEELDDEDGIDEEEALMLSMEQQEKDQVATNQPTSIDAAPKLLQDALKKGEVKSDDEDTSKQEEKKVDEGDSKQEHHQRVSGFYNHYYFY